MRQRPSLIIAALLVAGLLGCSSSDDNTTPTPPPVSGTPGIKVSTTGLLKTTEAGGTAKFTVVLEAEPTADVVIEVSSSNTKEGTVKPAVLTFTAANWKAPQTVTVTGVDDKDADGNQAYKVVTAPAKSSDTRYDGMDADDVNVENTDNESAGITVTPTTGLTTTEAGGKATFTVVLNTKPTADVTIPLSSSDETEGKVSPASLKFTADNWNAPQTVTVTGVDDQEADGKQAYKAVTGAAESSDARYKGLDADDVAVTNDDNEKAGITVKPTTGLKTTEAGGTATFTIVLNTAPTANVTIPLSSSDTGEGTVKPASVTFTPQNWQSPQTVTVTGVDDNEADGDQVFEIVTGAATSTDTAYKGVDAADVSVTNSDDESAGITVEPTSGLTTTEAGGTATFTVVLKKEPTANVTIPVSSSNTAEGTVSTASLVFTKANWNAPQTVTITGVDDSIADGNQPYTVVLGEATSTDASYSGVDPDDVSVSNTDNDSAGVTVEPTSGLVTTEAGGTATFTVVLNTKPAADVTIPVSSSNATEGTASTTSLVFTPANWNAPQTVTVTGMDDQVADGAKPYSIILDAVTSADTAYAGIDPTDVEVTNTDDDTAGITVTAASDLTTTEAGGTATFTVVLNTPPSAEVTIALTSSDLGEGTVYPASLTFTPDNWNAPQTVTVTGEDDGLLDGAQQYVILTAAAVSADAAYNGVDAADVTVTNTDNDSAGFTVSPTSGLITTEKGGTATFTVALNSQPAANVSIPVSSSNLVEGTVDKATLTFTPDNWNAPQTVTVTGVDDLVADGNQLYNVVLGAATSTDADYEGGNPADVEVSNTDDDSPGVTLSPATGLTTTESGGVALFSVVLNSKPTANVTIPLTSSKENEGTVSVASVTFTPDNWNAPQFVTITGVDDAVKDGPQPYLILTGPATSTDPGYSNLDAGDVSVTNIDNDTPGITVGPTAMLTTTEAGGTATFTVVLNAKPTGAVHIALSSSDTTEGTVSPAVLTFTPANWNAPQTVTVTGANDDVQDGNQVYKIITAAATSADPGYDGMNAVDVQVTNTDNDTAGITVNPVKGLTTTEAGGTATFTIVLNSEPTANVVVPLSSNDTTEGTVSAASLTFTPANWNAPQTVTVTGVNDAVQDGNQPYTIVTGAATSTDTAYEGIDADNVSVTNTDNDSAGITVTPLTLTTTESGGTATFSVVLNSEPTGEVKVDLSSSDTTEGTLSASSLVFTPANWNAPQIVTVTGIDDDVADGNQQYSIVTAAATSTDAAYEGLDAANVTVTNTDNDSAGITVYQPADPITTEAGGTATFRIVLNSEPTADVTIAVSSNDLTEGTVSPVSVTFTPTNWKAPQVVTVTGVNDAIADGNQKYAAVTAAAVSTDAKYNGIDADNVPLTNIDDDSAGITVSPIVNLTTTESGGTATFTVVLNSEPTANVTIPLSSSDLTEGTISPASLVFTPANWKAPQTVTITGVDDPVQDGNQAYTIVTGAAVSTDPNYSGVNAANVAVSNTDNDTAGVTISEADKLITTEAGGTAAFKIVLNSQPLANVTLTLSSSDTTEGTVPAAPIVFTPANWNAPQTITVSGVDDAVQDGNQPYTIVTSNTTSTDPKYNNLVLADVSVTNQDNDTAGITLKAVSVPVTTEAGGSATFSVVLNSQPTADVTIGLTSNDTTEGTITATSVTFTAANWNAPQIITVKGVDDAVQDGNQTYAIVTAAATSTDPNYNGLDADNFALSNTDNDSAGATVTAAANLTTTESGGTATFTVVLNSEPTANVTIALSSSDTTEGSVSASSLVFTPLNWNAPQTVTVTGLDDFVADGNQVFKVVTADATSSDPNYEGVVVSDVNLTNIDNDSAGIILDPIVGLTTTEAGGVTVVTVKLSSQPTANVTIPISSSDTSEGTVSTTSVTFTPANWNVPQAITIKGENDLVADGNQIYYLVTGPAVSTDPGYNGLDAANPTIVNVDNDSASVTVTPTSGLAVTEAGGTATFTVVLNSQPSANVSIMIASSDLTEATILPADLTFTPANWNTAQTITVTGIDDFIADGNQPFTLVLTASSSDLGYNNIDIPVVTGTNADNE